MNSKTLSRRQFVTGVTIGAAALAINPSLLFAGMRNNITTLTGNTFNLSIGAQSVNFTGTMRSATTVNNALPAPLLRFKEGEMITLNVTNHLTENTSIHWHGLILPSEMDGVPDISNDFHGIKPGETFTYRFKAQQSGTYWYHSHSSFQEQTGLYGPIVIDPAGKDPITYDKDYVVMLSDWTDENPTDVYHKLKKLSHYYNFNERTHTDLMEDIEKKGLENTWNDRKMWNQMRMSQRDLSDVTGYTYTYLANGITPDKGWVGLFEKGDKVRVRFINGSAMTFFDVRIPGLKMTVVAADGQNIEPVSVDECRIGVAETYDVIVEPKYDRAYTIFAQDISRSGYARGTLTPDASMLGEVPELDKASSLTHSDMGMNMSNMAGMDHSTMNMSWPMKGMDHAKMNHTSMNMKQTTMVGMDHSKMDHSSMGQQKSMAGMDHSKMKMTGNKKMLTMDSMVTHADTEFGPHIDMRSADPQYRLDDPGVGLRNNGRKVLVYADLRNLHMTHNYPDPDREIQLHLTGNMSRYMWSINGVKFADAEPLRFKFGEVVRITFVNDTMMNHPMHLHGMWSDLETGDNRYIPRKHTVIVQPGAKISYRVQVDAKGSWAYHCHLLYHMLGMFRRVDVV
ncbi:copper resistance system multicopper oxidase [bacterium endosymbiont of Bathymodiolus sp. 5 South]|jgi:CopA family copper-resistance protein|uniref:copper resistance system multicopper oxidase n=1 Tax=bacterium endosymbiont of Bathymodiolus sp. 5 South TaxID=1181670 RepID=UPI0010B3D45B|nr:copper resistance system multicopper oxidase [bacterium endosymbiont of Bathymodiolus sp. 5 South]CAC9647513.1 Multicopper oxidase [uncultured Gammaproteobacteria bacterium]CAC9650714.1 Multicopper oxidase [uncultured Gammaproteobacteria bacterium]SHN90759.1 Multicopper oxidase [bacterium endosymbiont of Bathymodiolus sp. 5 South]SSC06982.1 Multicopper oxidase [bacterium endosymbiont of Bathymodiolus sp. 5 South]VVH56493.1 Multicopper oxidase [uncultured Gammaproteobacteria bacterium]